MSRVLFEDQRPDLPADPNRADIACFVGLVRRTGMVIPPDVRAWLHAQGLLLFPFTLPADQPTPPVPANVQTWLMQQSWLQALAAPASLTTLAACAAATDTTLSVAPPPSVAIPTSILIDDEIVTVGQVNSPASIAVTRGQNGTTAATHVLGTPVYACAGSLAASVAPGDTQMTLTAALSGAQPAFLQVESEIAAVTALDASRTILTIQRGIAGSVAGAHGVAAAVLDLTADALGLLGAQIASGIPQLVADWLGTQGWLQGAFARDLDQLADVTVPVENFTGFTAMFDPGGSPSSVGTDYVAACVRSFFAQGGRRCYIVRMGDPVMPTDDAAAKQAKLQSILINSAYQAGDPSTWHGIGHLAGLMDVSYVAVPDLPVLSASQPTGAAGQTPMPPTGPEQFVECAQADVSPLQLRVYSSPAPRLSPTDYGAWAASVANILQYLVSGTLRQELHLREMQLVAAFPLPQDLDPAAAAVAVAAADTASIALLAQDIHDVLQAYLPEFVEPLWSISGVDASGNITSVPNVSSAFLQLAYPWLKTTGSYVLTESLEPPDGALVGILARNALKRGAFASATKITPAEIYDLWPQLPGQETKVAATPLVWDNVSQKPLIERVSLFGFTPSGLGLLSDVTAYPSESYRTACVKRLAAVISRAARNLGEVLIFKNNGPVLWTRVQTNLQQLLTTLWNLNALDGATAADAFTVRCDRSTMTQNDLDNGRLVAEVTFTAAATMELIRVTLALETDGTSTQQVAATLGEAV